MKSLRWLRLGLSALALAIGLIVYGSTALGQTDCIGDCLEELERCTNETAAAPGSSVQQQALFRVSCEDEYQACVERCLN